MKILVQDTVFMVMPFGDELATTAYTHITKPTVESFGLKIIRADEIFSTSPVFNDIVTAIEQAAIVIVDITGKNPNCFYELGMAHTLKQSRTIMITHDTYDTTPFDIAHFRIIQYQDSIKGKEQYEQNLRKTVQSILGGLSDLYQKEFTLVSTSLASAGNVSKLYFTIAISKTAKPITLGDHIFVEGSRGKGHDGQFTTTSTNDMADVLLALGYAQVLNRTLSLTEKGQAFADFLVSQGYICHALNDETFTPGHRSFFDRMAQKRLEDTKSAPKAQVVRDPAR